jgi:SAM-dependent methyltransferase
MHRLEDGLEILDRPTPPAERAASLADIERLNAWLGGHALTLRWVARALARLPRGRPVWILDVGAGEGGLAARLVEWARRAGLAIRVVALDCDPDSARRARVRVAAYPEIAVVCGDASALPVRPTGVDLVVSVLTLHHLAPTLAAGALGEMARASRLGFVVNDLWRARLALFFVWLATRLLRCHRISRHDGPLSVRRSYSPAEIRSLADRACVRRLTVRCYPWLARVITVGGDGP